MSHKMQEWLADRVSWVQYPNIRPANQSTRQAAQTGLRFAHPMPIGKRLDLFLVSFGLLTIGLVAATLVGVLIYCLL